MGGPWPRSAMARASGGLAPILLLLLACTSVLNELVRTRLLRARRRGRESVVIAFRESLSLGTAPAGLRQPACSVSHCCGRETACVSSSLRLGRAPVTSARRLQQMLRRWDEERLNQQWNLEELGLYPFRASRWRCGRARGRTTDAVAPAEDDAGEFPELGGRAEDRSQTQRRLAGGRRVRGSCCGVAAVHGPGAVHGAGTAGAERFADPFMASRAARPDVPGGKCATRRSPAAPAPPRHRRPARAADCGAVAAPPQAAPQRLPAGDGRAGRLAMQLVPVINSQLQAQRLDGRRRLPRAYRWTRRECPRSDD